MAFTVVSDSFKDGDYLGKDHVMSADFGFGCAGGNKSPHLKWSGAPEGTRSFAVTCYDPDAPTGSGFWHWLIVNIPPDVTELALGASASLVKSLEAEFPRPHKVVRLLLDPKASVSRKQHFSRYECGAVAIPSAEMFIRFQQQAAVAWKTFDTSGWKEVDASLSPELVLAHTLTFIGA